MNEKFIKIAFNEAIKAYKNNEIPVGAVIVRDNKILAKAYNTKERKKNVIRHAEINAIEKASSVNKDWRLENAVIFTTLFPCPMCASAIQQARIKKIVYVHDSNNEEMAKISKKILSSKRLNHQVEIEKYDFDNDLLDVFFKKIRNDDVTRET